MIWSDLDNDTKTLGMWAVIGLFVLVVILVSAIVWFKPTHLTFTGYEALVGMGRITYGTDMAEIAEEDLPRGTSRPKK